MKKYSFLFYSLIITIVLLFITIYRSYTTGITCDEAFTYITYVPTNPFYVFKSLTMEGTWANNHILNTFCISIIQRIFGARYNEFIIRIPNLISYLLYFIFAYLLCKDKKYKYSSFAMLTLNYGLNEFFGLARGYGMACSVVLIGIYFFDRYLKSDNHFMLTISYLFMMLSCYANTTALIAFAVIIMLSFARLFKTKEFFKYSLKHSIFLIPIIIGTLLIVRYHFMVSSDGLPLYGGNTTFYNDVLRSLITFFGFNYKYSGYIVNAIILISIIIITKNITELKKNSWVYGGILFFILLIIITKVTHSMWMTGRCLIPSIPLITIALINVIDSIKVKRLWIPQIIIIIPVIFVFITNVNLNYTREWQNDYLIREMSYEALKSHDNTNVIKLKTNTTTVYYRNKILEDYQYDILEEKNIVQTDYTDINKENNNTTKKKKK